MRLFVTVKAGARREQLEQKDETHFSLSVKVPPVDGKANMAVARILARHVGVSVSRLTLLSGATGKNKVFRCEK